MRVVDAVAALEASVEVELRRGGPVEDEAHAVAAIVGVQEKVEADREGHDEELEREERGAAER